MVPRIFIKNSTQYFNKYVEIIFYCTANFICQNKIHFPVISFHFNLFITGYYYVLNYFCLIDRFCFVFVVNLTLNDRNGNFYVTKTIRSIVSNKERTHMVHSYKYTLEKDYSFFCDILTLQLLFSSSIKKIFFYEIPFNIKSNELFTKRINNFFVRRDSRN